MYFNVVPSCTAILYHKKSPWIDLIKTLSSSVHYFCITHLHVHV
jgi:hypothetical protein